MSRLSRVLLAIASVMLLGAFLFPLWRIDLVAPQYPEGLGMLIRIDTVTGIKPNDLANINGLNHYIGMKPIESDAIPELRVMPWILGGLAAFGLLGAALGRRRLLYSWLGGFVTLAVAGLIDFWRWEYDYGHNIDFAHAITLLPDGKAPGDGGSGSQTGLHEGRVQPHREGCDLRDRLLRAS